MMKEEKKQIKQTQEKKSNKKLHHGKMLLRDEVEKL